MFSELSHSPQAGQNCRDNPILNPAWQLFVERARKEKIPFETHLRTYQAIFKDIKVEDGPPVVWMPDDKMIQRSNLMLNMETVGIAQYEDFYKWSVGDLPAFWTHTIDKLKIKFTKAPTAVLEPNIDIKRPKWFPGAELNIVDSCFTGEPSRIAIVAPGANDQRLTYITYGELETMVNRASNGFLERGLAPDQPIALYMPLTVECVIAYLAIIRAGSWVVSIADSYPEAEVRRRLALTGATCVITLEKYKRGEKLIPLYNTVVNAGASRVIAVLSSNQSSGLRQNDIAWSDFLTDVEKFQSITGEANRTSNILFSSGTTGNSKAIPWNHLTPIKAAMDGYYHQDIHADDIVSWPTNIGWMMGPWLIYASLINGACIALYPGATNTTDYLHFIQRTGVTIQGLIPSLVRTWKHYKILDNLTLPTIRLFSSTGEPASQIDYLWLMSKTDYRVPIIEYLGGTEIGGGHLTSTVLHPSSLATFTTPNLGIEFRILNETGCEIQEGETGELFLKPPALGLSEYLINSNHEAAYFDGCPHGPHNEILRRHGDTTQLLPRGYYRSQGRADDSMNLGGIKVSALEIEQILDKHPDIYESAAVATQADETGPERLKVFIIANRDRINLDLIILKVELQALISSCLNPLFKIDEVRPLPKLPKTPSGKIVRCLLREVI